MLVMPCLQRRWKMSGKRHRKTCSQKEQERNGIWACIKARTLNIVGHRLFGNWVALATLGATVISVIIGVACSNSSSECLSCFDGNDDKILHGANSTQDIEKSITSVMGKTTVTDVFENCASLSAKPIPQLLNSSELDFLAYNAFHAWKKMDFSNAVMNARCADKLIASYFPKDSSVTQIYIESNVWLNAHRVYPVLIDDAMSNEDYERMSEMADLLIASSPAYWAYPQAMKDIANLRKNGGRLFFFSPERVCELRKMSKHDLEQYLTLLTTRGYLAPYSLNYRTKDAEPMEWGEFFGIGHALPYLDVFHARIKGKDGKVLTSNHLYGQWVGLGKYELIDVNAEAARAMGLPESEMMRNPIRISGTITRERPQAIMFAENKRMQVPEPSSGMLLLIGLAALFLRRHGFRTTQEKGSAISKPFHILPLEPRAPHGPRQARSLP